MNIERDPDAIVAAWLEEGPFQLPHATRRAIATGIRTTHQARGWRGRLARLTGGMRFQSLISVGAAAVIVLMAVVVVATLSRPSGGPGGLGPTPPPSSPVPSISLSPSADPTAAWSTFVSARHGYTIRHPDDWDVTPATEPWPYGTGIAGGPGNPEALDRFHSDQSTSRIVVTSQLVPEGLSEAEWIDGYRTPVVEAFGEQCSPPPEEWAHQTIDGIDVGVYEGCRFVEAMAFAGDRVYTFTLDDTGYVGTPDPASRPIYDEMLRSITFRPETADDTPVGASPSP